MGKDSLSHRSILSLSFIELRPSYKTTAEISPLSSLPINNLSILRDPVFFVPTKFSLINTEALVPLFNIENNLNLLSDNE